MKCYRPANGSKGDDRRRIGDLGTMTNQKVKVHMVGVSSAERLNPVTT